MTFEQFVDKICLGYINCGTYISVRMFYEDQTKDIQLGLNPPVNHLLHLNLNLSELRTKCNAAMRNWWETDFKNKELTTTNNNEE